MDKETLHAHVIRKIIATPFPPLETDLDAFLHDPSRPAATLQMRQQCHAEGHKPYVEGGHGGSGLIHGCYCGWVRLKTPLPVPEPQTWEELPLAEFERR